MNGWKEKKKGFFVRTGEKRNVSEKIARYIARKESGVFRFPPKEDTIATGKKN